MGADAGQTAVNDREGDEPLDLGEDLGGRRPHGLNADEAVDAVAAGQELPEVVEPVGNPFAGIRHAAEHQYGDRGPEQEQERILAVAEERRDSDSHGDAGHAAVHCLMLHTNGVVFHLLLSFVTCFLNLYQRVNYKCIPLYFNGIQLTKLKPYFNVGKAVLLPY